MKARRVIRTASDLDEVHLMLADFGWFHFAVEDRHRRAWLIVENEHGDISATCGNDEWLAADRVLSAHGPLVLLQDLRPPLGRPAAPIGEPTDKSILEILGVSEEAVEELQKRHSQHKVMRYIEQGCQFCVGPIGAHAPTEAAPRRRTRRSRRGGG